VTADLAARVAAERAAQELPEDVERIRAQVRESRQRQGLPEHVMDPDVLDRLAADVLDRLAAMVANVRPEHDDGPGSGKPGRRSRPAAGNEGGPPHATQ
jgi:hypothetical protein